MSVDPTLLKKAEKQIPQVNDLVATGFAYVKMQEVEDYVDRIFRYAAQDFPNELQYLDYRRCTPEQEFREIIKSRESSCVYELARQDLYLVEYRFLFTDPYGEEHILKRYIYLPFVSEGGMFYIRGRLFSIQPVLADIGYSRGYNSLFIDFLRSKSTFSAHTWMYYADNERVTTSVAWSWLHHKPRRASNSRSTRRILTVLANYLFAKHGFKQSMEIFAGAQVVVDNYSNLSYERSSSEWIVCSSTQIKPRAFAKGDYTPSNLAIAVPTNQFNHSVRALLGGFFYILDHFPQVIQPDIFDNNSTDMYIWREILGYIIQGADNSRGKMRETTDKHLEVIERYVGPQQIDDLHDSGVEVRDIYEFLMFVIEELSFGSDNNVDSASMYNKRLVVLRYVLGDIISAIHNLMYDIKNAMERIKSTNKLDQHLDIKTVTKKINSRLQMRSIVKVANSSHREVVPVGCSTDNLYFSLTSAIVIQSNATGGSQGRKKTDFNDRASHLHVSLAEIGSFNNLPKSDPTGRSRINPFVCVSKDGVIKRNEDLIDWFNKIQRKIDR